MAVRFKSKRRCRNCPETAEGLPATVKTPTATVTTYQGEGRELWKATTVACGTTLELLFRYITLNVPGDPIPQLERLRTRLDTLIEMRKEQERLNESSSSG